MVPDHHRGGTAHRRPAPLLVPAGEADAFDGEMLAFVPPTLMELRWADDVLRFELEPDERSGTVAGTGRILGLSVTFTEVGKSARDAAGWHVCLERLCDGTPASRPDRWRELFGTDGERFGPEASAVGPPQVS